MWLWLLPAMIPCIFFFTGREPSIVSENPPQTASTPEVKEIKVQKEVATVDESPLILEDQKARINPNSSFEKTIKNYPPIWKNLLSEYCDSELINKLEACKNLEEAVIVTTQDVNPDFDPDELDAWLNLCMWEINQRPWDGVHFKDMEPIDKLSVLGSYLVRHREFKYSEEVGPENFNIMEVLKKRRGYCATLPIVFTLLAHRFKLPVYLVTAEAHVFARYDDGKQRINIESTSPIAMGVGTPDSFYLKDGVTGEDLIHPSLLKGTSLMKNLSLRESISILLMNSAPALSKKERFNEDGISRSPPKTEEGHLNDIKYAASALYFDSYSLVPILNMINIFKRNPDEFGQDYMSSVMSMAMRRGIVQPTPGAIKSTRKLAENLKREFKSINDEATILQLESLGKTKLSKEGRYSQAMLLKAKTEAQLNKTSMFLDSNFLLLDKSIEKELRDINIHLSNILKRVKKDL